MKETTVVNTRKEKCDVYIGRGSIWGNPFKISDTCTREQACAKFREWLPKQPRLMEALHSLKGKKLGCFCKPKECHGDFLCELANALPD